MGAGRAAVTAVVVMAWAAAIMAALTAWWLVPGGQGDLARLADVAPVRRDQWRRRTAAVAAAVAMGLVVLSIMAGPGGVAIGVAGAMLCGTWAYLVLRRLRRRRAAKQRAAIVHAGELMAGLLRVGRVPSAALTEAAQDAPVLRVAAAEHAAGGEAAAALRRCADDPGCSGLVDLADAWEISTRTGASLVDAVDAAARRLAAEGEVARVVDAELAAARLSGRMMALLPFVGLLLGFVLGGDPVAFLSGAPLGWLCLNVGVALACAGVLWIEAVAVAAGGR